MEEWLALNAERDQAQIVTVRGSQCLPVITFLDAGRTTNSDIVTMITTVNCQKRLPRREAWTTGKMKMVPGLKENKYISPFFSRELSLNQQIHRKNQALIREHDSFLQDLFSKREHRLDLEDNAATLIQSLFRGYKMRDFIKKEKEKQRKKARMRSRMKAFTRSMGILEDDREKKNINLRLQSSAAKKLQGVWRLFLGRRAAHKERLVLAEELMNAAAGKVQCVIRKRFSRRAAKKERMRTLEALHSVASLAIQCTFRGMQGRRRFVRRRLQLQTAAARIIQQCFRRRLGYKAANHERETRRLAITARAALRIQSQWRRRRDWKVVCSLRLQEADLLTEAGALSIQRVYRGHLGRVRCGTIRQAWDHSRMIHVAVFLQKLWRGQLGRKRMEDEKYRQQNDIFTQARLGNAQAVEDLFAGDATYTPKSEDENGNTVLLIAARWGHTSIVQKCLRLGMEISHVNHDGVSAVQLACLNGHDDTAAYLASKDADLDFLGRTLLHEAAIRGMAGTTRAVLQRGVPVTNQDKFGNTALHEAAVNGSVAVATLLVDGRSEVSAVNLKGETPLHLAATTGNQDVASFLVKSGCDASIVDQAGRTAWRAALALEDTEMAELLRREWAEVLGEDWLTTAGATSLSEEQRLGVFDAVSRQDRAAVEALLDEGLPVDYQHPKSGMTCLMCACSIGCLELAALLFRKGAKINRQDHQGRTSVHHGAFNSAVVTFLVENGGDLSTRDTNGWTPLHQGCLMGYSYSPLLIKSEVDVDTRDLHGRTPLHVAAGFGFSDCVRELLSLGAKVNMVDTNGRNAVMHYACGGGDLDGLGVERCLGAGNSCKVARQLLQMGGFADQVNDQKESPLHFAAQNDFVDTAAELMNAGASTEIADAKGYTPLFRALMADQKAVFKVLVDFGANCLAVDAKNRSLTTLARRHRWALDLMKK